MTRAKRFLLSAVIAGSTALVSLPADAFFGMLGAMFGGWGWGGWGYPGWGWGGYPGWGGWGYPGYGWGYPGYGWGYPGYGWGGYPLYGGWGYPYAGYPLVTAPVVATQPAATAEK